MSDHPRPSRPGSRVRWLCVVAVLAACAFEGSGPKPRKSSQASGTIAPSASMVAAVPDDLTDESDQEPSEVDFDDRDDAGVASNDTTSPAGLHESTAEVEGGGPSRCHEDMIEVRGTYCSNVIHRCIKGGKTHTWEATDEPQPFYCDAYQPGVATCYGRRTAKHFCIDEFEYPNQLGAIPMVMVTWYEAQRLCKVQGKRLCGDDEWTLACEGPEMMPYPYGWARDKTACNIDHPWMAPNDALLANKSAAPAEILAEVERLSKRVPSGSMPGCRSGYGVMDMGGNVDEWATNVTLRGKPYQSAFKGGHWVRGARNRCRPVTTSHDESTAYYAEGFRCCADVAAEAPEQSP